MLFALLLVIKILLNYLTSWWSYNFFRLAKKIGF